MHESDVANRYKQLFNQDSSSEMEDQFHAIVGEEFENVPATMLAAFKEADAQAAAATSPVGGNVALKQQEVDKICDSTIMDSLTLDEARVHTRGRTQAIHRRALPSCADYFELHLPLH